MPEWLNPHGILILHAVCTWGMVGLIWFVQIVHYPLFALVGLKESAHYYQRHTVLTTWVVAPLMLGEVVTALAFLYRPVPGVADWLWLLGGALLAVIWLSTVIWQVPLHGRLGVGYEPVAHRALVRTNWVRTVAWTLRGLLVATILATSG
jgi:hypothetical protein